MQSTSAAMATFMLDLLQVVTIHERTYVNSHSYRVTAEDGETYIMKVFPVSETGVLSSREIFASEIGVALGLSMASWKILQVDAQTCHEYHLSGEAAPGDTNTLTPGIYFASRVPAGVGQLRCYMSRGLILANPDIARQLGCIRILDVWLANSGFRRYVAMVENGYPVGIRFFGHSRILELEIPEHLQERAFKRYQEACTLAGTSQPINLFFSTLSKLTEWDMRGAMRAIPACWRDPAREMRAVRLLSLRRDQLLTMWRTGFTSEPLALDKTTPFS